MAGRGAFACGGRSSVADAFADQDILSAVQFTRADHERLFAEARRLKESPRHHSLQRLPDRILVNLFYEPSTRTSASFAAAMMRLGGSVFPISEITSSSVSKGESLPDTVRTLEQYADVLVFRHPDVGSAQQAAAATEIPVINAGDGSGEHPTQALLDLFTISEERGKIDGLTVTFLGDLKYGRTVHSLAQLLDQYQVKLNLVAPEALDLPDQLVTRLKRKPHHVRDLKAVIGETDVLYVTRVQEERFADRAEYDRLKGSYVVTPETLEPAKADLVIMHPLPRVDEIDQRVDADPRAAYFREVENGLYVRMALLSLVLGG